MAYGGWIELSYKEETEQSADGELIAVSADSVWLLRQDQILVIPTAAVKQGKLTGLCRAGPRVPWACGRCWEHCRPFPMVGCSSLPPRCGSWAAQIEPGE